MVGLSDTLKGIFGSKEVFLVYLLGIRDLIIAGFVAVTWAYCVATYIPWVYNWWGTICLIYGLCMAAKFHFAAGAEAQDDEKGKPLTEVKDATTDDWRSYFADWAITIPFMITMVKFNVWTIQHPEQFFGGWFLYKIVHLSMHYYKKYFGKKQSEEPDLKDEKVSKEFKAKAALRNQVLGSVLNTIKDQGGVRDPRIPGGFAKAQKWTQNNHWPIIDIRNSQWHFALDEDYRLEVEGVGEDGKGKMSLTVKDLEAIGVQDFGDQNFHCVTASSVKNLNFKGIPLRKFIERCNPPKDWVGFRSHGKDGYSSNVPREECEVTGLAEPFIAIAQFDPDTGNTYPIEYIHGVIRPMFPQLYGWKGSKWMNKVSFDRSMKLGFWERSVGAHFRGRIDLEERFCTNVFLGDAVKNKDDCESRDLIISLMNVGSGAMFRLRAFRNLAVLGQRMMGNYSRFKLLLLDRADDFYRMMGWKTVVD